MDKSKRIFWGIIFLLAALFLILNQTGVIGESQFGIWTIVVCAFCLFTLVRSIIDRNISGICLSLAVAYIFLDEKLGLPEIKWYIVILIALLISAGVSYLFPSWNGKGDKKKETKNDPNVFDSEAKVIHEEKID